ncbi:L-serine ammonia-lyase, iron-sulfur-dependent, subunit alpha [Anaerotignum sp. MSJ-24]|nr:L-serine ammonia-lyase, iron-sulfur-dependent, subunit alpha [Anaerotignum sp. MSJ-24]MBU5463503.1 L-serine ammonia-lyase, iron-sulfur-dependent, subunit alpha [Anaerotignum sp. MSJ-24]
MQMFKYDSIADLVSAAEKENVRISDLVIKEQAEARECSVEEMYNKMHKSFKVMIEAVEKGIVKDSRSVSGLTGGSAWKMREQVAAGKNICGPVFGNAMIMALAVSETNACMGKIVAAPTAGSCGILPAAILSVMDDRKIPEKDVVMGMFTASAIGLVAANKASIAGAEGGCQAECGVGSAMAAAAVTEMCGGTPQMVSDACAIAIKNILGLVCDPVAGLVEIPCIKRNAMGTANAFTAAELALAGITSAIPADETLWAMKKVGDSMSSALKETGEGGLAATPTGKRLKVQVFGEE